MGITRRSLLQLMAGASAGVLVSPLPWKLLDDASIWTQNWFLIPKLAHTRTTSTFATCGWCSGGCGLRIRLLGDEPIAVTGQADHPASHGGLCPLGASGPQLRFHPLRIARPVIRAAGGEYQVTTLAQAIERFAAALTNCKKNSSAGSLTILDGRPGSAMSALYTRLTEAVGGGHLVAPAATGASLARAARAILGSDNAELGYDFENARTVLSIGSCLFESWGPVGRMAGLRRQWQSFASAKQPTLIAAHPLHSSSIAAAQVWLPIAPGSETALALGLAHVLLAENKVAESTFATIADLDVYRQLVAHFPVERVAKMTGLRPNDLQTTARTLAANAPAIVVGGADAGAGPLGAEADLAILGLNFLLGSFNISGGLQPIPALPSKSKWQTISNLPDGSIQLLLVDSAQFETDFPWAIVQSKLAPHHLVVSLNPYLAGLNLHAEVIVPTAVVGEWTFDAPSAPGFAPATYGLCPQLTQPPTGLVSPPELIEQAATIAGLDLPAGTYATALAANIAALHSAAQGEVFDPKDGATKPLTSFADTAALRAALSTGSTWCDSGSAAVAPGTTPVALRLLGGQEGNAAVFASTAAQRLLHLTGEPKKFPLLLIPIGRHGEASNAALPQMLTKLYRETRLRDLPMEAHLNPETGVQKDLRSGDRALLSTPAGETQVDVVLDRAVPPGVVRIATAPRPTELGEGQENPPANILDLVPIAADQTWRLSRVELRRIAHG